MTGIAAIAIMATILRIHPLSGDTSFFRLGLKGEGAKGFTFTPGQFVRLGLEREDGQMVWRPYSMVSAAYDDYLEFYSIVVPGGEFTSRLAQRKVGDSLLVDRTCYGFLTADRLESGGDLWFLATGTGLAPFISILHDPRVWESHDHLILAHSTRTAAELRAAPEYVNAAAYTVLAGASYPHTLPYDSPLDDLRTYLQQSNITLWQLRQAFLPVHNPTLAQKASLAGERFGISPHELDLITSANFVPLATAWNTPTPSVDLVHVPSFLQAASISYEHLLELLDVVWVRGGGAATTIQGINDNCDLSEQTLDPIDDNRLDRVHRFLRLWRHAGIKMWELDLLLGAALVGNNTLDQNALVALFTFRMLQDATGLPVDRQLAFYQDIDMGSHLNPDGTTSTSLFSQLFLNPAVPEDSDLLALQAGNPVVDTNINHHLAAIQSALEVSSADAARLFTLTNGLLTLPNLSLIYRVNALARTLNCSLSDLQSLIPFTSAVTLNGAFASPSATLALIQQVTVSEQTGFSIDALVYLLTPPPWTTTTGITVLEPATSKSDGSCRCASSSAVSRRHGNGLGLPYDCQSGGPTVAAHRSGGC